MLEINAPNLYLFSYHRQDGLGISQEKSQRDYYGVLKQWVDQFSGARASQITLENIESFLDLKSEPTGHLKFKGTFHNHAIAGRYLRRSLNGSYGLIFDGSVQERYNTHQIQSLLSSLKLLTPEPVSEQSLGQTWLLSGVLETGTLPQIEKLAEDSYKTLISPEGWHYQQTGDYLGVKLYEFWRTSGGQKWENMEVNSHLLLVLYPDRELFKAGWGFYEQWQQVLWGRHQLIWAYGHSQHLKQQLTDRYEQVYAIADYSQLSLYRLKTTMDSLSELITRFNGLELNLQSMETTVEQYERYCDQLEQDADGLGLTELKLLKNFSEGVKAFYLPRLQGEVNQFRLQLERIQDLIQTIRGLVEIRQAQSDRTFKTGVGIVGVGVGTACIVAVASSPRSPGVHPVTPAGRGSALSSVLGLSLICGSIASLVAGLIVFLWRKSGK